MPALENPKHERFCQELLVDDNATQAYIRAGYSEKGADASAARLLGNARIKARVAELRAERAQRVQITQDDVLLRLIELGFSNMGDYVQVLESGDPVHDFTQLDRKKWGAVQELTVDRYSEGRGDQAREVKRVKFKLYDPRGAVVDVGKHLGMWPNRIEHTGKDGGPIEVAELTETERAAKATALIQTALKRAEAAKSGGKAKKR